MRSLHSLLALASMLGALSTASVYAQPALPPKTAGKVEKVPVINPEAQQLMYAMLGTYQALGSYSDQTHVTLEGVGMAREERQSFPLDGALQWQRPSTFRFEGTMGGKRFLALSDGSMLHAFSPEHPGLFIEQDQHPPVYVTNPDGTQTRQTPTQGGAPARLDAAMYYSGAMASALMFMTGPDEWARTMKNVVVLALEPDAEVEGVPCRVVNIQSQSNSGYEATMRLFIGRDDKMAHRMEIFFPREGGKMVETHSQIRANPQFPAATWAFQAPKDAKPVQNFPNPNPHELDPNIKIGDSLPAFSGDDLNGQPLELNAKSGKATIVYFFLMDVGKYDLQALQKLNRILGPDKIQIVAVSGDALGGRLKKFAQENKLTIPIYYDEDGLRNKIAQIFGVKGWTQVFVFGADGKLKTICHMTSEMEYMNSLKALFPGTSDEAFFPDRDERTGD